MEKLAEGYGLVEGPVWDPSMGLLFSDVQHGGVYCVGRDGAVSTVFEHRRGIGGMALHEAGGLVVTGRNVSFKPFGGGDTITLLDRDPENGNVGYNDLTTDSSGRIYVGSLGTSPVFPDGRSPATGDLHLIDLDGSSRVVATDIELTNGLGFSPDGRWLYHSDSKRLLVNVYPVEADGALGHKRTFAARDNGVPDGLAVASDGTVWVALAGAGHGVAVYDAEGIERDFIEIPQPMCTSLCFGGDDLRDLYIVSGSEGLIDEAGQEVARPAVDRREGAIYRVRVEVSGLPVGPARVTLP
jgi:gluconolactonase